MAEAPTVEQLAQQLQELRVQQSRIVILPRERSVRRFYGEDFPTFEREVKAILHDHEDLSEVERYDLVLSHVAQNVKDEVLCQAPEKTTAALLDTLKKCYGCKSSVGDLMDDFYAIGQREGEGVVEFSHRLNRAFASLQNKLAETGQTALASLMLRDRFATKLKDDFLRKQLREEILRNPEVSFLALRDQAARWSQGVSEATSHQMTASSGQLEELMKMQAEVLKSLQGLAGRISALEGSGRRMQPGRSKLPFTTDGKPICLRCKEAGHIRAECPLNGQPPRK